MLAAKASSISDKAAALILTTAAMADKHGAAPLAQIVATARFAGNPALFPNASADAIRRVLAAASQSADQVDLSEINEAFAVVPMIAKKALGLTREKLNVHSGTCALGHPISASGARVAVMLFSAMAQPNLSRGVAAECIGGGEATAIAIERLS